MMATEEDNLRVESEAWALRANRVKRRYFWFAPTPLPLGQDRLKQIPTPGPEGQDLSQGLLGGIVTGQIEPCITWC